MSAIGVQSQINKDRALWLSTIPTDIIHGDIICDTISANAGFISTLLTENLEVSTLKASTLSLTTSDVSGMFVSSLRGNTAFFSSMTLASDLSGGVGFVRFSVDASGIQVDGDPIRFDNLVYLTSTINIIQVSTLVDTDIFASNGYFSTLSTGILSSGVASIRDANISSLFVSSLTALDLSGDFAERWSAYPTLNSSIIFQPSYVLSNVNQKLYFAGQELTDASGGGIDWSFFPAQTDVSMNNFSLRALSTLQYQDGATLVSQTGNNLFYNGQPVQFGATSNVSQWANYPAVNTIQTGGFPISSLGNITMTANSNVRILADSFSTVADQGLLSPTVNSDINLTAQNGLKGRINLTANPGALGLFGEINMTANGGTVAGVGTGGLVSITANTPLGTLCNATSAIKLSASGINSYAGAIPSVGSLAGYNFIYGTGGVNIVAGPIPSVIPNTPTTTFLYGTSGVVSGSDFYTPNIYPYWNGLTTPPDMNITGRYIVPNLAQVYVNLSNVKNIYMDSTAQIQNANLVSTVSTVGQSANFGTGMFTNLGAGTGVFINNNVQTLNANTLSTSFVQAPLLSTININLSTINGLPVDLSGGGGTAISSFNQVKTSTLNVSSISQFGGVPLAIDGSIKFANPSGIDFVDVINLNSDFPPQLLINASTINIGGNNVLMNSVSTNRLRANEFYTSSISTATLFGSNVIVSTLGAVGGFPIKLNSFLEFAGGNSGINNVDVINLNPPNVPVLAIGASTIFMDAVNTRIPSLSSLALQFSTASCFNSNGTFNTALNIVQDTAGSATGGVQISVEGRSLTTGAVRHVLNMGFRASDGANYIQAVWPGQNLEDLAIEGDPVRITDGNFSTIFNQDPYALQTAQPVKVGSLSTTQLALSTIQMYEQSGTTPAGLSSLMNIGYGYDISGGANGFWIENYINTVDNFDFGLVGNGDGAYIRSWQNGRSTYSEMFMNANTMNIGVDDSVLIAQNGGSDFTQIGPTYLNTVDINVSTINGNDARPAYTNNLTLSSMTLIPASTTLMYWDTVTTSSNINTSTYDAQVRVTGAYKIGASFQFISAGSSDEVEFFILKNNTVISQSGGIVEVLNNAEEISYAESVEQLIEGDTIQIGCFTNGSGVFVSTINGNVIQSPACILTMYKVD